MENKRTYYTIRDASIELGISDTTLYAMIKESRLKSDVKMVGGRRLKMIPASEVERLRAMQA